MMCAVFALQNSRQQSYHESVVQSFTVVKLLLSMFLSPADIRGVTSVSQLEQLNKRYWYVCQDFTECKYPHQPKRFPEIMMCLPEIRCIAGRSRQKC